MLAVALLVGVAHGAAYTTKLRKPPHGFQLRTSTFEVPVGEREICQAVRLPIDRPMDIDRIVVRMPEPPSMASHHFAMFIADANAPNLPLDGPQDLVGCVGTAGQLVSPILAFVQRLGGDVIRFPKGVGVTVSPDQVLLLNAHWVNVGTGPASVDVAVNFRKAHKGSVKHHAKSFQLGTLDIDVPPNGTSEVTKEWHTPFPMDVVWASSHSHKHTTSVDVEALIAGAPPRPLVHTTYYADPDFEYFPPPSLRLDTGDAIRWTCRYANTTDHEVRFGVTSEDEMCFAVGFFVTDDDGPLPSLPDGFCFGNGLGLVCPAN